MLKGRPGARSGGYGWQWNLPPLETGLVHSGPSPVLAFGRVMKATGPALCSPLNGVGTSVVLLHGWASATLLNQNPTCSVWVGARPTSGSKPNIWSSRIVLIATLPVPLELVSTSDWYQAMPKLVNPEIGVPFADWLLR